MLCSVDSGAFMKIDGGICFIPGYFSLKAWLPLAGSLDLTTAFN